ncbi:LysR family transcriptional regulator [Verminephrobacter eiseniae]|uniref:LysR family transcriptional regulator n=1 Tax=Verminephrobacter eiseniae TaxID=364317 RepID=UPI002238F947|nr:LysR family transcriptional regulator [Verminephrobacter eiseniae]
MFAALDTVTATSHLREVQTLRVAKMESKPDGPSLRVKLRGLRAIVAVVDQGAVGKAAEVLHLSQPAVTRALQDIEAGLGFPLFDRTARGMLPTAAGRILGTRARRAFEELAKGCSRAIALVGSAQCEINRAAHFSAAVGPQALASLIAVADMGSGPRAGECLGRSQPTIHRNLLKLEYLVGVSLFQRTPRGTRLTEPGEALLRGVKLAFAEIAIAEEELAAFGGRLQGRVVVAALPLSSAFLLPRAIDRLLSKHPRLNVTVVDGTYDALVQMLRCADVDMIVGALRLNSPPSEIAQEMLFDDGLTVIARAQHPCLLTQTARGLRELVRYPWIVPLPNTPARTAFEHAFRIEGVACPEAQLQVNSPSVVRNLLLESDRLALLSPLQVDAELRTGQLVQVPLALRDASRAIGVATRRNGSLSPGSAGLLDELRVLAATLQPSHIAADRAHPGVRSISPCRMAPALPNAYSLDLGYPQNA